MGSKRSKPSSLQVFKTIEQDNLTCEIDFESWFYKKVQSGKFRDFQRNEVKVYLKESGLKDIDTESKFEETIKFF